MARTHIQKNPKNDLPSNQGLHTWVHPLGSQGAPPKPAMSWPWPWPVFLWRSQQTLTPNYSCGWDKNSIWKQFTQQRQQEVASTPPVNRTLHVTRGHLHSRRPTHRWAFENSPSVLWHRYLSFQKSMSPGLWHHYKSCFQVGGFEVFFFSLTLLVQKSFSHLIILQPVPQSHRKFLPFLFGLSTWQRPQ